MFSSLNLLCVDAVYVYFILFFLCNLFLPRVFPYFPLLLYPFFYVYVFGVAPRPMWARCSRGRVKVYTVTSVPSGHPF